MINILAQLEELPSDTTLCTLEVNSLYTSITHSEGISAIEEMLEILRQPSELPHNR